MSEELEKCRNCGSECDPKGWMRGDGAQGPECEGCGITTPDVESWNRLMGAQLASTGGEAVEVVAWMNCGNNLYLASNYPGLVTSEPLMTVAQHNRIVAAMQPAPAGVVVPRELLSLALGRGHKSEFARSELRALLKQAGGE